LSENARERELINNDKAISDNMAQVTKVESLGGELVDKGK